MKRCSVSLVFKEMHIKNRGDITHHTPADDFSIKQKIASAHEDKETQKLLYMEIGNVK